ncbi:response regulator [Sulfurimonas sp.]|uniref:response regulator n=1 Tax=Sulfurimonas sp. TaxID=2022749 RepID=UPI0025CDC3AC|nr:response regulator [Sulfurimonas sp.]
MNSFNKVQSLKEIAKNLKILYVEDDDDLRDRTKKFFLKIFNHVDIAVNGKEGLELYIENYLQTNTYYDIVISDIYMPKMDGIVMSKAILEMHKEQKIVIMSATEERKYLVEIIHLGIESFIQKPFDSKQMVDPLYKVCMSFQFSDLQYFKALTQASIVSKTNTNGVITYVNNNFCNITGYTREEMIGNTHRIFKHPDNSPLIYADLWQTITLGKVWRDRMINLNKDGSGFYAETTIIPLIGKDGNIKEYMAIRNDITDMLKLKREVEAKKIFLQREEQLKEAKKSFLLVFTHELKTPLNAIINFSKYIKKQMKNHQIINHEKISTLLDSVLNNATDMLENITQILEVSKLNTGKLTYSYALFNANELINHTIKKFDSLIDANNINLSFETQEEAFIYSDENRVKQIVSNVLSNAIKYGKDEINIMITNNSNVTEISIEDNGLGIKNKEEIFTLYAQEEDALLSRQSKGTGIGLYFVNLLCRDLKIDYKVEDAKQSSGTKFTLIFKNNREG